MTFESYLQRRQQHFANVLSWGLEDEVKDRNEFVAKSRKERVLSALWQAGHQSLYENIKLCYSTKRQSYRYGKKSCGSPYCPSCRNFIAHVHYENIKARFKEASIDVVFRKKPEIITGEVEAVFIDNYEEPSNEDHLHITGVVGLSSPDHPSVKKLLDQDKLTWNKIRSNINHYQDIALWVEVAYEFELVSWRYLEHAPESDYKKRQIKQLLDANEDKALRNKPFVFLHFHGMTNIPKEDLQTVFKDYYFHNGKRLIKTNKETGLFIQSLHSNKSLDENIRKISSYPFKQALRFKHSFIGSDHTSGELMEPDELAPIIYLYDQVKGKDHHNKSLFRSATNGIKPWNRLQAFIDQQMVVAKQKKPLRNDPAVIQMLIHLAKIKDYSLKKNKQERLQAISKQMKQMATIYSSLDEYPSSAFNSWFTQTYTTLYLIVRNLSHRHVKKNVVVKSWERLNKEVQKKWSTVTEPTRKSVIDLQNY
jgi:hypothetical protein